MQCEHINVLIENKQQLRFCKDCGEYIELPSQEHKDAVMYELNSCILFMEKNDSNPARDEAIDRLKEHISFMEMFYGNRNQNREG
jgi:hypothetical protein